ncbi:LysR family transcriptional regulator [Viridibacillus arvi]|uniref:LysR family transcriptional regulator n=1 Tax=Viridibacillus arvi TaxID=263475 RepID=UPI00187B7122|nr:LysR family transcriptional regulator [Viridibacillus sp. JNUCC-6]QOV11988.1 LysR family transcriptional regulator [Viridibacillus sp. JNUCC-6]
MELRELKLFLEVTNYNSFTKAAEHCYLSQSSLSKAIKKLEEELQLELFDRSTRHMQLTEAGKIVYKQSQKVFKVIDELNVQLDQFREVATGEIKLGIPPLIGTLFFSEIACNFEELYPDVSLILIERGAKVINQLVEEGTVDLGIVVLPEDESKFNITPFIQDNFVLFVHEEHRLAHKKNIKLKELEDEKFIIFTEDFALHDIIIQACETAGFTPNIALKSSQWDVMIEVVASKLGITLLPNSIFYKQTNKNVKIIPIEEPDLFWNLGVITKKNSHNSLALRELLNLLPTLKFTALQNYKE